MINLSNTEKLMYALCFLAGIASVFFIIFLINYIRKKKGKSVGEYDERQKAIQGVAYKYSFFTLIAYFVANGLYCKLFGDWLDSMTMNFIGICLGIVVFVSYSIMKDAYVTMSSNLSKYVIVFLLVSVINLTGSFSYIMTNEKSDSLIVNLICGITFLILTVVSLIKIGMDKKAEKEND